MREVVDRADAMRCRRTHTIHRSTPDSITNITSFLVRIFGTSLSLVSMSSRCSLTATVRSGTMAVTIFRWPALLTMLRAR